VTADEHIEAAEKLMGSLGGKTPDGVKVCVAMAQVHATLAVAQATIAANRLRPGPTVSPR
jgi:hypothetical protein